MHGFKNIDFAKRFCRSCENLRNFLCHQTRYNQRNSANRRDLVHLRCAAAALTVLAAA